MAPQVARVRRSCSSIFHRMHRPVLHLGYPRKVGPIHPKPHVPQLHRDLGRIAIRGYAVRTSVNRVRARYLTTSPHLCALCLNHMFYDDRRVYGCFANCPWSLVHFLTLNCDHDSTTLAGCTDRFRPCVSCICTPRLILSLRDHVIHADFLPIRASDHPASYSSCVSSICSVSTQPLVSHHHPSLTKHLEHTALAEAERLHECGRALASLEPSNDLPDSFLPSLCDSLNGSAADGGRRRREDA